MNSNKNILLFLALLTLALLPVSCKKENACDCIKRTGAITLQEREISNFNKIEVYDNLNVQLTQASNYRVAVESGKNLRGLIDTKVENGILTIKNRNRCNWARSYDKPLVIYVSLPQLISIYSDGTGKVVSTNTIHTDSLDIVSRNTGNIELMVNTRIITTLSKGSGDMTLSGATDQLISNIGGTSFLRSQSLQAKYIRLHSYSTGNAYVYTNTFIDCTIDREGDVFCYGNPTTVKKRMNANGNLFLQ